MHINAFMKFRVTPKNCPNLSLVLKASSNIVTTFVSGGKLGLVKKAEKLTESTADMSKKLKGSLQGTPAVSQDSRNTFLKFAANNP